MNTYTPNNVMTVSDMRLRPDEVLRRAQEEPVYLFHRSLPKAIVLSINEYVRLRDMIEDYELSLKAEEYEKRDVKKINWVSHEQIVEELKKRKLNSSNV